MLHVICDLFGATIFFYIISYTASFSGKNVAENKTRVLIFSTFLETILILRGIKGDAVKNMYRSLCKVPVILAIF